MLEVNKNKLSNQKLFDEKEELNKIIDNLKNKHNEVISKNKINNKILDEINTKSKNENITELNK